MTNAVQILSNTHGRDNHVINQVDILLRELCRLHTVPLPPDLDILTIPLVLPPPVSYQHAQHNNDDIESDCDDIDDVVGESDQDSEAEEDLPLEMDDGRNTNKVKNKYNQTEYFICGLCNICT